MKITGYAAIEYAEVHGLTVNKCNDPIEEAREGLAPTEARKIAAYDPTLIYINVELSGWTEGDGSGAEGYNVDDYFSGGSYLGPDEHGIEPVLVAA